MSVRVPAASEEQIHANVLPTIAAKEGFELPPELAGRIGMLSRSSKLSSFCEMIIFS
jgi:hypothetical protein